MFSNTCPAVIKVSSEIEKEVPDIFFRWNISPSAIPPPIGKAKSVPSVVII
jgi:hypothetical protein